MKANLRAVGAVVLGSVVLGACATKGFVRTSVRDERAARIAADSSLSNTITTEVAGVRSEITTVKNDVASLRNDLSALRTEFGAKITAMEEGLKFAFPVNFAFDDAAVREADKAALDRFAGVVNKYYSGSVITIEGFADPAGSTEIGLIAHVDQEIGLMIGRGLEIGQQLCVDPACLARQDTDPKASNRGTGRSSPRTPDWADRAR